MEAGRKEIIESLIFYLQTKQTEKLAATASRPQDSDGTKL